jgi:hypothetical protein
MRISDYRLGFELAKRFCTYSEVVTTINYYTTANLHNLRLLHITLLSLFPLVFTIRFLAKDTNYKSLTKLHIPNTDVLHRMKRPLGRPRRRWVDNIKMDLRELGWDGVD